MRSPDAPRGMVVARIAVRDVAADRALVAHLRIGYLARALDEQRTLLLKELRPDDLVLGRHRADSQCARLLADALELRDAAEIDQMAGLREAELHHGQQAVTPREQLGVVAEPLQQAQCVGKRRGRVILELARNHRRDLRRARSNAGQPSSYGATDASSAAHAFILGTSSQCTRA